MEGFEVGLQTGFPLQLIPGVAIQNAVVTNQTAFDFVQPELVSVLDRMGLFAAPMDVGMLFKQTDDFCRSRDLLMVQNASLGLLHHLFDQRHEMGERFSQSFGFRLRALAQLLFRLGCPLDGLFG